MSAGTKGVPRERRERQILDVATLEFGTRGHAAASVNAIAAAAGVSKPLIYTYFGSRDGLHAACVHRAGAALVEAVAAAQTAPGAARAPATLAAIFRALDGRTQDWRVVYDPTLPAGGEGADAARRYQRALNDMGSRGVAEVLAASSPPDPADHSLLRALWFNAVTTVITWWADHPDQTPEAMAARCARLFAALRTPE